MYLERDLYSSITDASDRPWPLLRV